MSKKEVHISDTRIIIRALRVLAEDIICEDGVTTAALLEAADRLVELEKINSRYEYMKTLDNFWFNHIHFLVNNTGQNIDDVIDAQLEIHPHNNNIVYKLLKPLVFADVGAVFTVSTVIEGKKQFDMFVLGGVKPMNEYENGILRSIVQQTQWIKRIDRVAG